MSTTHEIEVIARDAQGREARVHGEFTSNGDSPEDAAHEVLRAVEKDYGKSRVREVDPAR